MLVEARRENEAIDAARACRVTVPAGWCGILEVYARASLGSTTDAEATLDTVLAHLTTDERCVWTDVSQLISENAARATYRALDCAARDRVDRQFWWLADPSYLVGRQAAFATFWPRPVGAGRASRIRSATRLSQPIGMTRGAPRIFRRAL
jgi:hypothetical protein